MITHIAPSEMFRGGNVLITHGNLFSLCVFRTENIGGVAASQGGWRKTEYFFRHKNIRDIRHAWDFYFGHKDIRSKRPAWDTSNPSVTHVTAPLSLRAEEQKCTTMQRICSYVLIYYPYVYTGGRYKIASLPLAWEDYRQKNIRDISPAWGIYIDIRTKRHK